MKVGIGIAFFILTLIFANMALENNKLTREITMREFDIKPQNEIKTSPEKYIVDVENEKNETNNSVEKPKRDITVKLNKWKKFEEDFDRQWKNF